MLLIPCPWCGPRDEHEFSYGGEAHIIRPADPYALDDEQWADYLFMRKNPKGMHLERWLHAHGCRRWFNVARDTVSHEIAAVYRVGEKPPRGVLRAVAKPVTTAAGQKRTTKKTAAKKRVAKKRTSSARRPAASAAASTATPAGDAGALAEHTDRKPEDKQ